MNTDNDVAVCNQLDAYINQVQAQSGKHIEETDADTLVAGAQEVIELLGCR